MWITGFDVPSLTYMYNDKPLKKYLLIQTISRVNRKYPGKEYGMIVDYIGIRNNMREAMKIYGGNTSVAPTTDDVEQATTVFREELSVLNNLFSGYDLKPFLNPDGDPFERYKLLAKAAEYVFASTQELQSESNSGKSVKTVSFKTYAEEEKRTDAVRAGTDPVSAAGVCDPDRTAQAGEQAAGGRGGVSAETVSDDRTAGNGGGIERPLHQYTEYRGGVYGKDGAGSSDGEPQDDGKDAKPRRTGWEESRAVYFELLRNPFKEYRDAGQHDRETTPKNIENYDNHGGIGGGAVAAGLRGILEAGSIIDGTAEDPEERRKRIEAQENASNLGAVIGLAVGILTAAADSEEDMSAEENDGPTIKM